MNSEITQFTNNQSKERDVHHDYSVVYTDIDPTILNNGFIDVTEEQEKMSKRFFQNNVYS